MNSGMNHGQAQELLPLLALDALSPEEEFGVRAHLETCQRCSALLTEHVETAGSLALLAEPAQPSPEFRQRVLSGASRAGRVVPIGARPAGTPSLVWRRAAAAFAAAAVVALGAFNLRATSELDNQRRLIAQQRRLVGMLASSSVRTVALVGTQSSSRASGRIIVPEGRRATAVLMSGLGDPGGGVYQLWLTRGGKALPLEAFEPDPSGFAVVFVDSRLGSSDGMAVSVEPARGSTVPRGPIILRSA